MEDAELEELDDVHDPTPESEDEVDMPKQIWFLPILGLFFLLLAMSLMIFGRNKRDTQQNSGPSEALISYQNLSNEMHTGVRLARLDDFLAQFGNNSYAAAVRARRNALKRHEEKGWAQLTNAFYDADADDVSKALAIKAYTDIWTPLHRPEQLKTLEQILPNDAVPNFNPGDKKSRFASGGNDRFLEGAPIVRSPIPTRAERRSRSSKHDRGSRIVEARVRSKRTPSYPSKARRRGVEAMVILELDIDDRGRVQRTHVVSVNAERYAKDFVKAAQRAARRTRFYPKTIAGRPVPTSRKVQRYAFKNRRN